jgi:A/G-specific adenine glycosylase
MDKRLATLLRWYRVHGRVLPWRNAERLSVYGIFISELMLQQTQVPRVIPKYDAWMKRFPTWKRLADARTADLIHAWAGLGYNRRALQARDAARYVVEHKEPRSAEEWRHLKGVGPYMAAALAEFANHERAIVIDTNVRRVAGRVFFGVPHPNPSIDAKLFRALDKIVPERGRHWDIPQAFMDLGSAICSPRAPACASCPLKRVCKAAPLFLSGNAPMRMRTASREKRYAEKPHPDRIYRGRILALVRSHRTLHREKLANNFDPDFDPVRDQDWRNAMIARLVKDGLLAIDKKNIISLPKR